MSRARSAADASPGPTVVPRRASHWLRPTSGWARPAGCHRAEDGRAGARRDVPRPPRGAQTAGDLRIAPARRGPEMHRLRRLARWSSSRVGHESRRWPTVRTATTTVHARGPTKRRRLVKLGGIPKRPPFIQRVSKRFDRSMAHYRRRLSGESPKPLSSCFAAKRAKRLGGRPLVDSTTRTSSPQRRLPTGRAHCGE